jgi:hypothetical protein
MRKRCLLNKAGQNGLEGKLMKKARSERQEGILKKKTPD